MSNSGAEAVKDEGNRNEIVKAVLDKLIKAKNKKKIKSVAKKLTAFGKGVKYKKKRLTKTRKAKLSRDHPGC